MKSVFIKNNISRYKSLGFFHSKLLHLNRLLKKTSAASTVMVVTTMISMRARLLHKSPGTDAINQF